MKLISLYSILLSAFFLLGFTKSLVPTQLDDGPQPVWASKVGAKQMPAKKTIFKVNTYGADQTGKVLSTKAIQA